MTFHKLNEDPFYDDDGQLVDEDDWSTAAIDVPELEEIKEACYIQDCDPFSTINS